VVLVVLEQIPQGLHRALQVDLGVEVGHHIKSQGLVVLEIRQIQARHRAITVETEITLLY
jgi:hypothetical protein